MQRSHIQVAKVIAQAILFTSLIFFFLYDDPFTLLQLRYSPSTKEVMKIISAIGVVASVLTLLLLARFRRP